MMKRWLSILLSLCIACTCCAAFAASADSDSPALLDVVTFGTWTKPLEGAQEAPIEWYVMKLDGDAVTLMSVDVLTLMAYNEGKKVPWCETSLCAWLNESFLELAFTDAERELLMEVDGLRATIPSWDEYCELDDIELRLASMEPMDFEFWWVWDDADSDALAANAAGCGVACI